MMRLFSVLLAATTLSTAGCAIHPLPDDVTGLSTARIVRKIRCEAREAVRLKLVALLRSFREDTKAQSIADDLEASNVELKNINYKILNKNILKYIKKYEGAAIAYNFSFDMTEVNNASIGVDALRPFSYGAGMLGAGAGLDRSRQNIRSFTVADSFSELINKVKEDYCNDKNVDKNYIYPIVGNIGVNEMIDSFIDLNEFANLGPAADAKEGKGPPTMADTITFTTKLSASLTPKIQLMPTQPRIALSGASIGASASRQDVHKVIIGLSLPVKSETPIKGSRFEGEIITSSGGGAKSQASLAIQQQIIRYELSRPFPVLLNNGIFSVLQ